MSADQTTADDHDDAAFRARLAPLASEVLPGGAKPPAADGMEAARPRPPRRLTARAGLASEAVSAAGSPAPVAETTSVPTRRADWRIAALAGVAMAVGVGSAAWIYLQPSRSGKQAMGVAFTAMTGAPVSTATVPDSASGVPRVETGVIGSVATDVPHPATIASGSAIGDRGPRIGEPSRAVVSAGPTSSVPARANDVRGSTTTPIPGTIVPGPIVPGTTISTLETGVPAGEPAKSGKPTNAVRTDPPSPSASSSEAMIGLLLQRGDAALAVGDIIAARLLFERAASLGSPAAATAAGKTYDIDFLLRSGARGIRADPAMAATWFRRAAALGDADARARLERIEAQSRR